jgi:hypothetical protein
VKVDDAAEVTRQNARVRKKGSDMPTQIPVLLFVEGAFGLVVMAMLGAATFFTMEQRTTVSVQRLGKFLRHAAHPRVNGGQSMPQAGRKIIADDLPPRRNT